MKNKKSLDAVLRAARMKKKMSLRDIQRASGGKITGAYVSLIEKGRVPTPHKLLILSQILGLNYITLMERAGYLKVGA